MKHPLVRAILFLTCPLLLLPVSGQAQDSAPSAWSDFVAWYRSTPGLNDPATLFAAYGAKLKSDGLSDPAIRERLATLKSEVPKHRGDLIGIHFDKLYANPTPPFKTDPSAYLVRAIAGRTPGAALDVGMGQGRNALYLASQGWQVTGYDLSEGGMTAARAEADKRKLSLTTVRASHDDFDYGVERWDLVVMTYAGTNMDDKAFLQRVSDSLKPGGIVVVEQFNAAPDKATNKGPANALFKSFEGLRVIQYEDTVDRSEWGGALCRIGRITAEKDKK